MPKNLQTQHAERIPESRIAEALISGFIGIAFSASSSVSGNRPATRGRDARFSRQTLCRPATRDERPAVSETRASSALRADVGVI